MPDAGDTRGAGEPRDAARSRWLVTGQMLGIGALVLLALPGLRQLLHAGLSASLAARQGAVPLDVAALIAIVLAAALALWALRSMSRRTFSVLPEPTREAQLTTRGPYRWIRHPMYSSVLLGCAGLAVLSPWRLPAVMAWLALLVVLLLKIRHEETLLLRRYPDYTAYAARTRRLLPGAW